MAVCPSRHRIVAAAMLILLAALGGRSVGAAAVDARTGVAASVGVSGKVSRLFGVRIGSAHAVAVRLRL